MEITREFSQEIAEEMEEFELFDEDVTMTTIVARQDGEIVAFCQEEANTVYEIESQIKGAGRALVEWMQESLGWIEVKNSGKDSWGFWTAMGFTQTAEAGYYGEFEWEA